MKTAIFLCLSAWWLTACQPTAELVNLTAEYLENPIGIDAPAPRLSWQLRGPERGLAQSAYEINVWTEEPGSSRRRYVWQTGKVFSPQSLHIPYGGEPLESGCRYYWQARVWDRHNEVSRWSEPALWQMGLLDAAEWQAQWIGLDVPYEEPRDDRRRLSARLLRREIELAKPVAQATVFLSGLGFSELYINGQRVGDRIMDPTHSNCDRRVPYVGYDVTGLLREGPNALGVILGNGRFFAPRVVRPAPTPSFGFPKMLLHMDVLYADGSRETFVSDGAWKITDQGPIRANNEFDGEEYDARMEQPGWNDLGFDDAAWQPVQMVEAPHGELFPQTQEPMRVIETLRPVSIRKLGAGKFLADFGQNLYGMCRIRVKGEPGTRIEIRSTFDLHPDGTIDMAPNRSALSTDVYTLKGGGTELWAPRFRGQGTRYAEVSGWPGELGPDDIELLVVHSDLKKTGSFACSDSLVNRIYENMHRTVRMQERGLPMDPDRDERQAWLSVSEMTSETEGYMYNVAAFYENFLAETRADQRADGCIADAGSLWAWSYTGDPCWPSVITTTPWSNYYMYGDARTVELCYPVMKRWVEYLLGRTDADHIYRQGTYSDWVDAFTMDQTADPFGATPKFLLSTAYLYYNLKVVERTARFLQRPEEADFFAAEAAKVKEAFNGAFLDRESGRYEGDTQAGYALAFEFGLVPDECREQVAEQFVRNILVDHDGHLTVGCPGTKWLMQALTNIGRTDVAYTILTRTTRPSWGYMVSVGGTSIWERWDCNTASPGMNGQSQTILAGYLGAWMYRTLAGIAYDPTDPGFRHIVMKPEPAADLTWVNASFESLYGVIESRWKIENGRFLWDVTVPPNSTATLYLPTSNAASVTESGHSADRAAGVEFVAQQGSRAVYTLASGRYSFGADYTPES